MLFLRIDRSHKWYRQMLSQQMDGQLGARAQAKLDAHLASCSRCRQEAAGLRQTVALLRSLPPVDVPRSFVLSRLPSTEPQVAQRWSFAPVRLLQLATSVSALVLVALVSAELVGAFDSGSDELTSRQAGLAGMGEVEAVGGMAFTQEHGLASAGLEVRTEADAPAAVVAVGREVAADEGFSLAAEQEPGEVASTADSSAIEAVLATEHSPGPSSRSFDEWLLIAVALATAALALAVAIWTWRLPLGPRTGPRS